MELKTILGRVHQGKWSNDVYNIITLIIEPRQTIVVHQGNLTKQKFEQLKNKAAFITLRKTELQQLDIIIEIVEPFSSTQYENSI